MQNKQFNILKGIGIILVVIGHTQGITFTWYQVYSFHIALFFFISGYFYNSFYENNQMLLLKKRIKSLIVPYFSYNLLYALIYCLLNNWEIGVPVTLYSFFIQPFLNGGQYPLFTAGWFIITLFAVQFVFINIFILLKKFTNIIYVHITVMFLLSILGTYLSNQGFTNGWWLMTIRILFGMFFYYLGIFYKEQLEHKNIFTTKKLFLFFIFQVCLVIKYVDTTYYLANGVFNGRQFLPIFISISGIYFYLFVSKALSNLLQDNDLLIIIGKNSLHILSNHLLVFFLLSLFFVQNQGMDLRVLNDVWYKYHVEKYWLLYVSMGVLIPVKIADSIKCIRNRILHQTV